MTSETIAAKTGLVVKVVGVALNAHAGAVVVLDDETPVYVEGLTEWPEDQYGQSVEMSGILHRKGQTLTPAIDELATHGLVGMYWLLELPKKSAA